MSPHLIKQTQFKWKMNDDLKQQKLAVMPPPPSPPSPIKKIQLMFFYSELHLFYAYFRQIIIRMKCVNIGGAEKYNSNIFFERLDKLHLYSCHRLILNQLRCQIEASSDPEVRLCLTVYTVLQRGTFVVFLENTWSDTRRFAEGRGGFLPSQACTTWDKRERGREWVVLKGGRPDTLLSLCSPHTANLLIQCSPDSSTETEWKLLTTFWKMHESEMWRCDPSSSPYPFCLVMEMWHGRVSKYKPIDSVSVYVVRERNRLGGWQKKKWKGKEKIQREKNTHSWEKYTVLAGGESSQETDREREVQHCPQHF